MDVIFLHSVATVFAATAFTGICVWAYSGRRKADFEQAAHLPFADDMPGARDATAQTRSAGAQEEQQ